MYHRVIDLTVDPWGLAVRPDYFEEQMDLLRRTREAMPLMDFVAALRAGHLSRDAVAVTFDDGYRDNLLNAKPIMQSAKVPGTLFLATGSIGDPHGYWWDELAHLIFHYPEATQFEIDMGGHVSRLELPEDEGLRSGVNWKAWDEPRTAREGIYYSLWRKLRDLDAGTRSAAMDKIRSALSPAVAPDDAAAPMDAAEIGDLIGDGLVEIGCHTTSHSTLPTLDPDQQRHEIEESRRACEQFACKPVGSFAYPYGAMDKNSRDLVERLGFEAACSTRTGPVPRVNFDRFALPRIPVGNWGSRQLAKTLDATR